MSISIPDPLDYYARPGLMTDPKEYDGLLEDLPTEIPALRDLVQGLLIHIFWAERYGLVLSEERKQEVQMRTVSQKLGRILELADHPLTVTRPLEKRLVGNCRDFSEDIALLDHIARLTVAGNEAFPEVRSTYENEGQLRPPPDWQP